MEKMWYKHMYVCIYVYVYICMYIYIYMPHTYNTLYTYTYIHVCVEIYTHTIQYYSAIKKDEIMSFVRINGSGDHCVKWNKPDWERQILHVLFHMQYLEK
jgi:hypothetical protein